MRGVEMGSIGRGISVAPAIARGIGPAMGRIPSLEGGFSVRSIANPFKGTENKGYIENRGPSLLDSNIGVIKNPEAKRLPQTISDVGSSPKVAVGLPSGPEAVDIAEQWLKISSQPQKNHYILGREHNEGIQQRIIEPVVKPRNFIWKQPEILPLLYPEPLTKEKNNPKIQPNVGQIELSKSYPHSATLTEVDTKSAQENVVEQNLEGEVLIKKKVDEKSQVLEKEEVEESKQKDLLDEETAEQRIYEISEAIDLAEAEAKKEGLEEIEGSRILKFLRLHIGLISRIARKIRKDGSLDETLEEIKARRFSSKDQAKAQTKELVAEKEPVRRGKEGKAVKEGALERVFRYYFVKRSANAEVDKRVVKKLIQTGNAQPQVLTVGPAEVRERTIEEAGLAELFKKAA